MTKRERIFARSPQKPWTSLSTKSSWLLLKRLLTKILDKSSPNSNLKIVSNKFKKCILETSEEWQLKFLRKFSLVMPSRRESMRLKSSSTVQCSSNLSSFAPVKSNSSSTTSKICVTIIWLNSSISHLLIFGEFSISSSSCTLICLSKSITSFVKLRLGLFVSLPGKEVQALSKSSTTWKIKHWSRTRMTNLSKRSCLTTFSLEGSCKLPPRRSLNFVRCLKFTQRSRR